MGNSLLKRAPAGLEPHVWTSHIQGPSCRTRRGRGVHGEGSNKDKECAERRCRPRSPPARRESAAGDDKALSVATSWTDGLGAAAACGLAAVAATGETQPMTTLLSQDAL